MVTCKKLYASNLLIGLGIGGRHLCRQNTPPASHGSHVSMIGLDLERLLDLGIIPALLSTRHWSYQHARILRPPRTASAFHICPD